MNKVKDVSEETKQVYLTNLQEKGITPGEAKLGIEYQGGKMQIAFKGSEEEIANLLDILLVGLLSTKETYGQTKATLCEAGEQFYMMKIVDTIHRSDEDNK